MHLLDVVDLGVVAHLFFLQFPQSHVGLLFELAKGLAGCKQG
jgi:hypothetical protein